MLDVQQLFTVTRARFLANLTAPPLDALKAFHIHSKHRTPSPADEIPWVEVFMLIRQLDRPVVINPEVHHFGQTDGTIRFCRYNL